MLAWRVQTYKNSLETPGRRSKYASDCMPVELGLDAAQSCAPQLEVTGSLGRLVRLCTCCCTLGLARLGATNWGKLPSADPMAGWDLLFRIFSWLAASAARDAALFSLPTMPWGPAGLINFSEVWEACNFAEAVNSVLFEEVLIFLFSSAFISASFFPLLSVLLSFLNWLSNFCFCQKAVFVLQSNGLKQHTGDSFVGAVIATSSKDTTVWYWDYISVLQCSNCAHILLQTIPRWADAPAFYQTASGCKQRSIFTSGWSCKVFPSCL